MGEQAAITDNAEASVVLKAVRWCAKHWQPEVRIIGNVRAGDIARSLEEYADRLAAAQVENEWLRAALADLADKASGQIAYWQEKVDAGKTFDDCADENGLEWTPLGDDDAYGFGLNSGHRDEARWWQDKIDAIKKAEG